jgi:hypothetical protein
MEVVGKIKMIGEIKTFGTGNFAKREMVVTTDEQYPQMIMVEFVQDKCNLLDNYVEGQDVKIGINLRGREWINLEGEAKYFNAIQGWRIESNLADAPASRKESSAPNEFKPATDNFDEEPDDLPF